MNQNVGPPTEQVCVDPTGGNGCQSVSRNHRHGTETFLTSSILSDGEIIPPRPIKSENPLRSLEDPAPGPYVPSFFKDYFSILLFWVFYLCVLVRCPDLSFAFIPHDFCHPFR
jgi:hypothetical protein